jgi:hypothetical protein
MTSGTRRRPSLGRPLRQQDDALQMLRNLHDMMKSGGLSESEFRTKKWELLSTKLKQLLFARLVAPLRPPSDQLSRLGTEAMRERSR